MLRDGLVELEEAALVEHHRGDRDDGLGHRVHAHDRVEANVTASFVRGGPGRVHVAELATARDEREHERDLLGGDPPVGPAAGAGGEGGVGVPGVGVRVGVGVWEGGERGVPACDCVRALAQAQAIKREREERDNSEKCVKARGKSVRTLRRRKQRRRAEAHSIVCASLRIKIALDS
eukprot:4483231-Pleurochrysis_carterae.AAC.1